LGGETATLPGLVKGLDLAGTALGVVTKDRIIDGSKIRPEDTILGLSSSGIHSNGYTLARKILLAEYNLSDDFGNSRTVGEELLVPTRIYRNEIERIGQLDLHGLAHITGGGYTKLRRLTDLNLAFDKFPTDVPSVFKQIQRLGEVETLEMFRTYNMGFGFIVILPEEQAPEAIRLLGSDGECKLIGHVEAEREGKISFPSFGVEFFDS